jgi:hypothetical protein
VSSESNVPERLTWDLDGEQPLRGSKSKIVVPPHAKSLWVSFTLHDRFKAQFYVATAGERTLTVRPDGQRGHPAKVSIDAMAVTLSNVAVPKGGSLDESLDPAAMKWSPYKSGPSATPSTIDGYIASGPEKLPTVAGKSYFVDSEQGDDATPGTSSARPWKTLSPVNTCKLGPGDAVLLKRGGSWQAGLAPRGEGKPGRPILLGAYGTGAPPRIDGGRSSAVQIIGASHWIIQDLEVTNDIAVRASAIKVSSGRGRQPVDITIRRCMVLDAGGNGIEVGAGEGRGPGYDGVTVEDCLVRWCNGTGITVSGTRQDGGKNTVIRRCTVYGCGSSGIIIHSGEHGLIERCVAHNNGWMSDGTVGIWCWNARNITIRHCESYRTMYHDGAGFDIDWSCMGCTIEYCYSHDNDGEGYLLMGSGTATFEGFPMQTGWCVARYNVSESDGLRGGGGAGIVSCETFEDSVVYNNTLIEISAKGHKRDSAALYVVGWELTESWPGGTNTSGGWPARTRFSNNVVVMRQGTVVPLLADEGSAKGKNTFDHNLYFATEGQLARWSGKPAPSMAALRKASGEEAHGVFADPKLADPLAGVPGRLPMDRLRPAKTSPVVGAGTRVTLDPAWRASRLKMLGSRKPRSEVPLDVVDATQDFSGRPLPTGRPPSIGALEPE